MNTKCKFILILLISFSLNISAQSDKDIYWILEDFYEFSIAEEWIIPETSYKTYPNDLSLTTYYANFEDSVDCAHGSRALRIRGLLDNGSASFTVPDASIVNISVAGKKTEGDRIIYIYRNDILVKSIENIDKRDCVVFSDTVNSPSQLTYKITGGDPFSDKPVVLFGIEAIKYGQTVEPEPEPDYNAFWIYEDFSTKDLQEDNSFIEYQTVASYPNNIPLSINWSNIERGEGCSAGSKILRISGRELQPGDISFTVENARTVTIGLTGKAQLRDREILVYKNGELDKTFAELDRYECVEYIDEANSATPITYLIKGGDNLGSPIALMYILAEKYDYNNLAEITPTDFSVYPNPASDIIFFGNTTDKVELFDTNGRLLLSGFDTESLNISALNPGFYILKLSGSEKTSLQKLIKK